MRFKRKTGLLKDRPVIAILICLISCNIQKPLKVIQFYPLHKTIDTALINGEIQTNREDFFLVENYKSGADTETYIDSFVEKNINSTYEGYKFYAMYFFKKTKYTNLDEIKKNARVIDRYSVDHDLVYQYLWDKGKFDGRYKIKNGEIIEPKQPKFKFIMEYIHDSAVKK